MHKMSARILFELNEFRMFSLSISLYVMFGIFYQLHKMSANLIVLFCSCFWQRFMQNLQLFDSLLLKMQH
jgi:hypothetical protein